MYIGVYWRDGRGAANKLRSLRQEPLSGPAMSGGGGSLAGNSAAAAGPVGGRGRGGGVRRFGGQLPGSGLERGRGRRGCLHTLEVVVVSRGLSVCQTSPADDGGSGGSQSPDCPH